MTIRKKKKIAYHIKYTFSSNEVSSMELLLLFCVTDVHVFSKRKQKQPGFNVILHFYEHKLH